MLKASVKLYLIDVCSLKIFGTISVIAPFKAPLNGFIRRIWEMDKGHLNGTEIKKNINNCFAFWLYK